MTVTDSDTSYTGLRVLELSNVIAGPLAAMIFADLGADVIKIEKPVRGDDSRATGPFWGETSTIFQTFNRNKRSIVLDLKTPEGVEQYLRIAEQSDVVVEGFRPGVADRLGIGFAAITERNPDIIYCQVSGFGNSPSGAGLPGYDPLIQASSGLMSMTGTVGEPPVRSAASVIDLNAGMWAAMGIMAALARRDKTGEAQFVESTLVDTGFMLLNHQIGSMLATGYLPEASGSASPVSAPFEAFETSDGWVMIACGNDAAFTRLCTGLGMEYLLEDPRFMRNVDRVPLRDELHALIHAVLSIQTTDAVLEQVHAAGVPVSRINTLPEAVEQPLVAEREIIVKPTLDPDGGMAVVRLPIDNVRPVRIRRAPALGEHTDEVLQELGISS